MNLDGSGISGVGNHCVYLASLGETCEGHDESTGEPFPNCELGLRCLPLGPDYITIPGAESHCVYESRLGEKCEGFDESTGKPFPSCEYGLFCVAHQPSAWSSTSYFCK
mmetsp:Transcript_24591/g.27164  ORF Transcript_24591/g.27164 Transcript_24591/m.27164 type:complete len:109 (+) Transcript_24591:207-533(+)